jgi:hypothetical protein
MCFEGAVVAASSKWLGCWKFPPGTILSLVLGLKMGGCLKTQYSAMFPYTYDSVDAGSTAESRGNEVSSEACEQSRWKWYTRADGSIRKI